MARFGSRCAVTRSAVVDVLIASHIVPWKLSTDEEKLDVENGILLSPNYDALFDRNLITFEDDGSIKISSNLSETDCGALGIDRSARIDVTDGIKPYLKRHRDMLR